MDPAKRIVVNTGVQYVKAIITTCLSLFSTRLILDALNINDYGIYSVIAGVVAMLGFITNALIITTQRYLSVYKTKEDTVYMRKLFSNSLLIHFAIGILICFSSSQTRKASLPMDSTPSGRIILLSFMQ